MTTPNNNAVPRIFVSHSRKDNLFCRPFVAHLRTALGLTDPEHIFYDETSIHISDDWLALIQREVIARPIFLLILTPRSVAAEYVRVETTLALRQTIEHKDTRRLISLLAEECDPNELAPLLLNYQIADFVHKSYDAAFMDLLAALRVEQNVSGASSNVSPTTVMVTPPSDQAIALVQQMMPQIETAYAAQDWLTVVDKMAFLVRRIPATLPPGLYRMQAEALLAEGQPEQARAALDAALALDHLDVSTLQLAAHVRNRLGQYAEAVPLLQDALAVANNSAQRLALLRDYVQALIGEKQWSEALRRCEEAQRLAPNDATLSAVQLQLLSEVHRDADALTLARTLTARPDATLDWWLARARLARSVANDTTEVQTALDAAVRLAPNNPAVSQARHDLLPPPIAPDRFPQRLASFGFTGHTTQVNGKLVEYIVPPLCEVPAGPFLMGSDPKRDKLFARYAKDDWAKIEAPQHSVTLPAFAIARYPVTVAEYACFVRTGQREPEQWQEQLTKLDHPVGYISWWDATAYVVWLAERTGQSWHLPNEAEWEKAARGTDGRLYPWGDTFEKSRCNINVSGIGNTTPVGTYPSGASPYGVQDLAGNVWEWASDPYQKYPYKVTDFDQNTRSNANRIVRGGSNGLVTLLSMHVYLIEASGRPTSMLGVPDSA